MGEAGRGDRRYVRRVDDSGPANGERGVHELMRRDHSRPVERVGHERGRPQERPPDAAVADRLLAGPVPAGDRVGGVVSDVAHGQLDDPLHARSLRRGYEPLIVRGVVEPVGEQEHRVYTVQHGCQVAVAEIGDDLLGAVWENRARIAGEDPYVTCLVLRGEFGVGAGSRRPELRPATTRWAS